MEKIEQSPYDVLEIYEDFSIDNVKKKYFELLRKYPPEKAPEMFIKIRTAYERITKPYNSSKSLYFYRLSNLISGNETCPDLYHTGDYSLVLTHVFETPFNLTEDIAPLMKPYKFITRNAE